MGDRPNPLHKVFELSCVVALDPDVWLASYPREPFVRYKKIVGLFGLIVSPDYEHHVHYMQADHISSVRRSLAYSS